MAKSKKLGKKRARSVKRPKKKQILKRRKMNRKHLRAIGRALRPYVQPGPISLAKKHGQPRRYIHETRGLTINTLQDKFQYGCLEAIACYGSFDNILSASGQEGALGSSSNDHLEYHVYDHVIQFHFRNTGNHAAFLHLYEVAFRNNHNIDTTTNTSTACATFAMNQLNQGWEKLAAAGEFGVGGTIAAYTEGNTTLESNMKSLTPYQSIHFTQQFKIMKVSRVKLAPGDDYWYKIRVPAHTFKAYEWNRGDDLQRMEAKARVSKLLLYGCRGALGKGTEDDTKSGWMSVDLALEKITKAKVVQVGERDKEMGVSYTSDDLTTVTLEAGTEHAMAVEND